MAARGHPRDWVAPACARYGEETVLGLCAALLGGRDPDDVEIDLDLLGGPGGARLVRESAVRWLPRSWAARAMRYVWCEGCEAGLAAQRALVAGLHDAHWRVRETSAAVVAVREVGAQLTVVETGFDTLRGDVAAHRAAMADHAEGWERELDELVAHVTTLRRGGGAVADLDAGTITRTVLVGADRPTVWRALTTPAAIEAWWGHPASFPDGVRPGSLGTFELVGHGLFPVLLERVEEPSLFTFTWGDLGETEPGPRSTHVRFDLVEAGEATLVTVVESGFDRTPAAERRAAMEQNTGGWDAVLDALVAHVEGRAR